MNLHEHLQAIPHNLRYLDNRLRPLLDHGTRNYDEFARIDSFIVAPVLAVKLTTMSLEDEHLARIASVYFTRFAASRERHLIGKAISLIATNT